MGIIKGEGKKGRPIGSKGEIGTDVMLVYEEPTDDYMSAPTRDLRTKAQKKEGVLNPAAEMKAAFIEAFYADTEESEGGYQYFLNMRKTHPHIFAQWVTKLIPGEEALLRGASQGPLHHLERVMNDESFDVKIRTKAAEAMLSDRNRVSAVANLLISDIFAELKKNLKELPATQENMGDFIDRLQHYAKILVDDAMSNLKNTQKY
jgi:hypothetical protein